MSLREAKTAADAIVAQAKEHADKIMADAHKKANDREIAANEHCAKDRDELLSNLYSAIRTVEQ